MNLIFLSMVYSFSCFYLLITSSITGVIVAKTKTEHNEATDKFSPNNPGIKVRL